MEQSAALYRKWRPLTFGDVVGQDHITAALRAQVQSGRVSHAYLFTGTRGTGKTTCAKILARAVCCENPKNGEPCNECPSCRSILDDSASDFSEIDAASNNSVDNIRDLRDEVIYSPVSLSHRVYIIDEVHMLSPAAFNALLKTLEEPPSHVLFILATTEIHKVPATILSRCQRFDFRRIAPETIADRLLYIAEKEGYKLTPDAAADIARLGDGSMRDAISLYDRCMPYDGTVDAKRVEFSLGIPSDDAVVSIFEAVVKNDAAGALSGFSELYADGKDMITTAGRLLALIRDIYVIKATGKREYLSAFSYERVKPLSSTCSPALLEYCISCISDLLSRVTRVSVKRADCEICLFKMAMGKDSSAPGVVLEKPAVKAETHGKTPTPAKPAEPVREEKAPESNITAPPKRTESAPVAETDLAASFKALVISKVNSAVKVYLPRSEITAENGNLRIAPPKEALRFMQNEEEFFREAAKILGFKGVVIGSNVQKQPVSEIFAAAEKLGIPINTKKE